MKNSLTTKPFQRALQNIDRLPRHLGVHEQTPLPLDKGPYPVTDDILGAGGRDYAFFDSTNEETLFQDQAGTTPTNTTEQTGRWNVLRKTPHFAINQTDATTRPVLEANGLKFDASNDSLLTTWTAQEGANCIIVEMTVPSSGINTEQVVCGQDASPHRFSVFVDGSGRPRFHLPDFTNMFFPTGTFSGSHIVVALSIDGAGSVLGFAEGLTTSSNYTGTVATDNPFRIGATNPSSGIPANFFGGHIKRVAFGHVTLNYSQFQRIRSEWLTHVS